MLVGVTSAEIINNVDKSSSDETGVGKGVKTTKSLSLSFVIWKTAKKPLDLG